MSADRDETPHTTRDDNLLQPLRPQTSPSVEAKQMHRLLEIGEDLQHRVSAHLPPDTLPAPEAHAGTLAAIAELKAAAEKQVTATKAQYDDLKDAMARLSGPAEDWRQGDPAGADGDEAAKDLATTRVLESAALLEEKVVLLASLCDDLEAAVQRIPRSAPVQAPPEAPHAAAGPAPGSPGTFQAAGGISEELVAEFARIDRLAARIAELENAQRTLTEGMSGGFETVHTSLDTHDKRVNALHESFRTVRKALSTLADDARKAAEQSRNLRHFRVAPPVILLAIVAGMLLESQMFLFYRLFR